MSVAPTYTWKVRKGVLHIRAVWFEDEVANGLEARIRQGDDPVRAVEDLLKSIQYTRTLGKRG